ncbi:hypothetical protein T06_15857 [Trichinella sp. T6]|nr:hypothetical protein T06_15857 [Trichinella sp. T6]
MVKPFATLNTMISAASLRTLQRPCVLDCRKCPPVLLTGDELQYPF